MSCQRRVTVITGASSGLGAELARIYAAHGHDLALVARNATALEGLAGEIAAAGDRRPLVIELDLRRADAADELGIALNSAGATLIGLVNNAGYGLNGNAADLDRADQGAMIDLNVRSLTDLTLRFLPSLIAARGKILNVASTAAFLPGPGMAVYYATKAYVLSFSEAISRELKDKGVTVTALCPGPTLTGFQARAGLDDTLLSVFRPMAAQAVARIGYNGLMAGRRVVVPGFVNKLAVGLALSMPRGLSLAVVAKLQASRRR